MNEAMPAVELLEVLRTELNRPDTPLFEPNEWLRKLKWRTFGFQLCRHGKLTCRDAIRNLLLPATLKPDVDARIMQEVRSTMDAIFRRLGLFENRHVTLAGKPFFPAPGTSPLESWFWTFMLLQQVFAADQYHAHKFLKPDSVVIDAGANIGVFSILAALQAAHGRIFAFEPFPSIHDVLLQNVAAYPHIHPVRVALGDEPGAKRNMVVDSRNTAATTLVDSDMVVEGSAMAQVPLTSIDAYVEAEGLSHVDFIKVDVEGYEARVIKGATMTLRRHAPVLAISAYHKPGDPVELRRLVQSIQPAYRSRLYRDMEADLIFWKPHS